MIIVHLLEGLIRLWVLISMVTDSNNKRSWKSKKNLRILIWTILGPSISSSIWIEILMRS